MRWNRVFGVVAVVALLAPAAQAAPKAPAVKGTVWVDADRDGVRDSVEAPAAGVIVRLERKAGARWKAVTTTKTANTGRYSGALTARGSYRVVVTKPATAAGFSPGRQGKRRTLDSDVDVTGRSPAFIRRATTIDVGLLPTQPAPASPTQTGTAPTPAAAPAPAPGGTVTGRVWREVSSDGRRAAGEPAAPVTTVQLWNEDRTQQLASTTTSADEGSYVLTMPTHGARYRVRVVLPDGAIGYAQQHATATDGDDSDLVDAGAGAGYSDAITATGDTVTLDAGLRFHPPTTITGVLWRDDDNDGIRTGSDGSIGSRAVEVWTADKLTKLAATTSLSSGAYTVPAPYGGVAIRVRFLTTSSYPIGKYHATPDSTADSDAIQYGDDDGWTAPITLGTTGAPIEHLDAAAVSNVNLGDRVWVDTNGNAKFDSGEPGVANVTVELWNSSRTTLRGSTTTSSTGNYALRARGGNETYCLQFAKPSGRSWVAKDVGDDEQIDSDVDSGGVVCRFVTASTISITNIDAGLSPFFAVPPIG